MTNSDKIRKMSDEQLADFIDTLRYNCCDLKCGDCPISWYVDVEGECNVFSWLKQEVQEDEAD